MISGTTAKCGGYEVFAKEITTQLAKKSFYRKGLTTMFKKILITGISGQLGSNLAYLLYDRLSGHDIEILGLYNTNYAHSECIKTIDTDNIFKQYKSKNNRKFNPDLVIHCAALANVDVCETKPDLAFRSNVLFTKDVCTLFPNSKVIYISTDNVYYGGNRLYAESDATISRNNYGMTKILGENIVRATCDDHLIIRTNIYGWDNRAKSNSFLERIFRDLMSGLDTHLFYDVIYCPISINLLFEVLFEFLQIDICGTYNLVGPSISKLGFGELVSNVFKFDCGKIKPISIDDLDLKAQRAKVLNLSNKKTVNIYQRSGMSTFDQIEDMKYHYKLGYKEKLATFIKIKDYV